MSVRVGVIGAAGRMGREVCRAVDGAADLTLVAAVDPHHAGATTAELAGTTAVVEVAADLDGLDPADVDVVVDFSLPIAVGANLEAVLSRGIHAVVGATGLTDDDLRTARRLADEGDANALIAPNFAIGAVLLMRFAAEAARHLPHVEVIEAHHDRKVDAPSGTALRTAELIAEARAQVPDAPTGDDAHPGARGATHAGVRVHSLRLPGVVADQDVVFGGLGQTLTISHRTLDRTAFMPGVVLACREVHGLDGLVVGLEHLL